MTMTSHTTGAAKMADGKIVILGGKGMLGTDLATACQKGGIDAAILDLPEFDITNSEHVKRAIDGASVVVNCAAYTNVDKAESDQSLAYRINAQAVGELGAIAKKAKVRVLHISTDFVFDGKSSRPYVETDKPNPINAYGKSKLEGERLLVESGCESCIIRIEWTYGFGGNNFVTKLITRAKQASEIKVVTDQTGSPTATAEVAGVILKMLEKKAQGLFHFAADGYVSRFEMAKFILKKFDMDIDLTACLTSDFPSAAQRPLNSCFDCDKIQAVLDEPIKAWQGPLEKFLGQL